VTLAEVGGAQTYVIRLLEAARSEFDVTVAAHGDGPVRTAADRLGVPFVPLRRVRRSVSPYHDLLGLLELRSLFRRLRPDIVHLNSSKVGVLGRVAARLAGVPACVFTVHGWAFKAGHGRASVAYLWADRLVEPLGSAIVCVSETERRAGLEARTCTAKRTVVIPNAVRLPEPVGRDWERPGPVDVVTIGRLAEPKDFPTLVRALAELPDGAARLLVLGDGPLRAELEQLVQELSVDVVFAGEVADVSPWLAEAQLFALSSRSEGMPMSVLEAMAAGLPVVASDVGGIHEVVEDGVTGRLVPAGDPHALAGRLAELVLDGALRQRFGSAGRRRVEERFALPRWRDEHLALYRSLLRDHTGRRLSSLSR